MSVYRELLRQQALEDIRKKLTPEDMHALAQLTNDARDAEILQALHRQGGEIAEIHDKVSKQTWLSDFSSNIAGNAVWGGAVWVASQLLRRL